MFHKNNHRGFTLFELMVSMVVFAVIMTSVLESVGNITIARTRTMNKINLLEELYFFSETLATKIKDGGIIDYEEYWNRNVIGTATASGHYRDPTGFGNYGSGGTIGSANYGNWHYYCRSGNSSASRMGTGGCLTGYNDANGFGLDANTNYSGAYQRYGEYKRQFTDYNGNADDDVAQGNIALGDEDGTGSIIGDEDDKDIGDGPKTFSGSVPELYLINTLTNERIYFRRIISQDPGLSNTCNEATGSGCIGNIEILKLVGKDIGKGHDGTGTTAFDGEIDTWVCHSDWSCTGPTLTGALGTLPTGTGAGEWIKLFPDYVDVRQLSFTLYPEKDPWMSWAAPDCCPTGFISPFIHPYVRLQMTLGLAWERRRLIKGDDPTISVSTTISLTGY